MSSNINNISTKDYKTNGTIFGFHTHKLKKFHIYLFIYLGSWFYVLASYYHLGIKNWTFIRAFAIAIPLVMIEYFFSLHGNRFSSDILDHNPVTILLITMCFYFINTSILNYVKIKKEINYGKEFAGFFLVILAFLITQRSIKKNNNNNNYVLHLK